MNSTDELDPIPATRAHDEPVPEGEEEAPRGARLMAVVRWGLVLLMAGAAAGTVSHHLGWWGGKDAHGATYYCPMHPGITSDQPGQECPICSMSLVKRGEEEKMAVEAAADAAAAESQPGASAEPALPKGHEGHRHNPKDPYRCSMDPMETATDPSARCPVCGMKMNDPNPDAPEALAPVPDIVPIDLSTERIQLTGMRTAKVVRGSVQPDLRAVGVISASEDGLAQIQTRFAGWIEDLVATRTGQHVDKGQVLATIYSPELLAAQYEYLNAVKWTGSLKDDARKRLELLGIAPEEIAEIDKAKKPIRALPIRSPVSGHVLVRNAVRGGHVQPGTELFEVADLSRIWVLADVYESEVSLVRAGQKATLTLPAWPGETFEGELTFLYPTLDPETRTLRVRLEVDNPDLRLRPGMYGDVIVATDSREGLLVSQEAVVDTGELQYVFVARKGGRFEPKRVKLGMRTASQVEIVAGLEEGDTVVTTGNFLLDSESRLRAVIESQAK